MLISYLSEDQDAQETARYVEEAGRRVVLVRGDVSDPQHCRNIVAMFHLCKAAVPHMAPG